jgi:DNA-binding CsgD family transcriptional regulator/tetratricopeptide (TPR) repeat protein
MLTSVRDIRPRSAGMAGPIIEVMAVRVSSPVLIGRAVELDGLRAALAAAAGGRSTAILVAGEAGVGKTRLVTDFASAADAGGSMVLTGGCIDLGEGALPYAPVVEALRGLVRRIDPTELDGIVGQGRAELARLVPDLGPVTADAASGLNVGSAQGRLFELVLGVLERLGARSPLALIVEDLHWSDRSTRDLLGFLVRNLREARVALVLTYRSDELHRRHPLLPFLAELERSGRVERLELGRLDQLDSAEQLRAIAGHALDPALIESIHARSGGNPFFAEELLVAAGDDGTSELPPTLRDVLLAHVADLSEPTQEMLRIASAAGQRVDPTLVAEAAGLDETALYEALRECVARQVLVFDPTSEVERYAFRHALLQEAVYDDLLPGERTRLHSAFARTLEARVAADDSHAAELAYHWYAAHDLSRALAASLIAAADAESRYAFPEAQAQYERVIELWDHVPDAEARAGVDRIEILARLAGVAHFHDPGRAITTVREAIRLAEAAADPIRAAILKERLGRYAWIGGQGELAQQAYRAAVANIPADPPSAAHARALAGLAQILMLGARFEESRAVADRALTMARSIGARDIEGHALNTRAMDCGIAGEIEPALADMATAQAIAEELGLVDDIGRAYANRQWVLDSANRLDEALAIAEQGVETSGRLGLMRFFGAHLLCYAADALYRLGRWEECEAAIDRALAAGPIAINVILERELRGRLAMARGEFEEAASHLKPLGPLADRAADIQFVCPVKASLIQLALWQGRVEEAVAIAADAIDQTAFSPEIRVAELHALGLRAAADAADLARARRRTADADRHVSTGKRWLAAVLDRHADVLAARPVFAPLSDAWMLQCVAETARLERRPDPEAWAAAGDAWDRVGRPYQGAYVRWREAEARLAVRGDRGRAAGALRTALAVAERLGAAPLAREITALAARARLSIEASAHDEAPAAGDDEATRLGLTAREREVLGLVALGRTNRQIADELFISENTAGVHVSRILGKLEVGSRTEAAAIAHRLGLVEPARESVS